MCHLYKAVISASSSIFLIGNTSWELQKMISSQNTNEYMNILEANGGQHPWTNLMCCDHPNMHESEN
jgi:hypothetical protein